ncbi:hypothetical protein Bca52824_074760 [Brassica carinata]|uniref:DUF1985 domain-containing protein n=2 Tax=Brassica TaxID=3705 RepID=A0A8X7TVV1_BRACI|nr:hypothetical protein Bca52824_074760 [Brassica carinata]
MSPKTRLAQKKEKAGVSEKKKNAGVKRKEAAAKRRAAVKKKRDAAKRSETTKKKRKRDRGLDGGSSSNPTKRARNRVRETAASPPEHQGVHSPTPAAELPSQGDSEGTPHPVIPSQPQKLPTPTHAASEAENPQQPRVTSGSSTKSPSHHSNAPEVAVDNDAPRTVDRDDMTVEADRPAGFFFKPSDYGKCCKLSLRCHQHDFLKTIEKFEASEKSWFQDHPQFKHIFHMDCTPIRKVMGLWMLLLRTMHTGKGRQAWFGVNGVPIRYSIREHSLLSCLYCHSYPENYPSIGSMKFARKHFKVKKTKDGKEKGLQVTEADVLEKLQKMKFDGSGDRLRMAVLYFLARDVFLFNVDTDERFDDDGDEQSTLQIMAGTAERFEKAATEKTAADKTNEVLDDDDALEKEVEVGVDDSLEEAASVGVDEMPKRVPKRSHLLRSPFTPN